MGGKSSGGSGANGNANTQTVMQTSSSAPWGPQQQPLMDLFTNASNAYGGGYLTPSYYPGQSYAPPTDAQNQALASIINTAQAGSPLINAAQNTVDNAASGNFLSAGNPYFQNMFQQVANSVTPAVTSAFEGNGRYGSGAAANALASALANQAGNLAYQNYNQGMQNMLNAATAAPALAQASFLYPQAAYAAGAQQQANNQAAINDAMARYNYDANIPYLNMQRYQGLITGNYGGTSTSSGVRTATPSLGSQVLGGLQGLGGFANQLFGKQGIWPGGSGFPGVSGGGGGNASSTPATPDLIQGGYFANSGFAPALDPME